MHIDVAPNGLRMGKQFEQGTPTYKFTNKLFLKPGSGHFTL
jgi:hypothetical protein